MLTSDFNYHLPSELIAQTPANPRDSCRLLVLDRQQKTIEHRIFSEVHEYLLPEDLLVINETKVIPARLLGTRDGGKEAEVLLLQRSSVENERQEVWEALVRPGKRLKPGSCVQLEGMKVEILDWAPSGERGQRVVRLIAEGGMTLKDALPLIGKLPLPPYITDYEGDPSFYQTVYAVNERSAAAPTAGLHFTPELMDRIRRKGIRFESVDLAVGLDTFRPIEEESVEEHVIHSERYSVDEQVLNAIRETRRCRGRVIAVGTTSVRSLESTWDDATQTLMPRDDEITSLFITPGYTYKVVDALLTNFHAPRSTLLALVSAFASRELIMKAYNEAVKEKYRFLSFGDAMLIL